MSERAPPQDPPLHQNVERSCFDVEPGPQFIKRQGGVQVQQLDADNDAELIKIDVAVA